MPHTFPHLKAVIAAMVLAIPLLFARSAPGAPEGRYAAAVVIEVLLADGTTKPVSACVIGPKRVLTARHGVVGAAAAWVNLGSAGIARVEGIARDEPYADLVVLAADLPEGTPTAGPLAGSACASRPLRLICARRMPDGRIEEREMLLLGPDFRTAEPVLSLSPGLEAGWSGSPVFDAVRGSLVGVAIGSSRVSPDASAAIADARLAGDDPGGVVPFREWSGSTGTEAASALQSLFAMQTDGKDLEAVARLASVSPPGRESWSAVYSVGMRSGRPSETAETLRKVSDRRPTDWWAAFYAGWALSMAKQPRDAITYFERARSVRASPGLDFRLAREFYSAGDRGRAVSLLLPVSAANACYYEAHESLFRLLAINGVELGIDDAGERMVLSRPDDPLVAQEVLTNWAKRKVDDGRVEALAAKLSATSPYGASRVRALWLGLKAREP